MSEKSKSKVAWTETGGVLVVLVGDAGRAGLEWRTNILNLHEGGR